MKEFLEKQYKDGMSREEAVKLAVQGLLEVYAGVVLLLFWWCWCYNFLCSFYIYAHVL